MRSFVFLVGLIFFAASVACAEPMAEADIPIRCTSWHVTYEVNPDGSYAETQKWSREVLKENILERSKRASITFKTSVAKGEILEAYTVKKSGQRIDAPKESYQVSADGGYKSASPLFSDETTISVAFPDLAVGDSAVFSSRIAYSEGTFPNHFTMAQNFSRYAALDNASIEVIAPASMKLRHLSYFLTEHKPEYKDGKQILRWDFQNRMPEKWIPEDKGIFILKEEPALYISTFKSYKEVAEAYGRRATPKAATTERVKKLASEIVAGKTTPEAKAHALYDWVSKNIFYKENDIGVGGVVPRDLSVVLDNKLGDCKDHVTLLQALLAAVNIESEQALVNSVGLYQLPEVPVLSAVNHVVNYIPSLNLFLDSTASYIPFGMLPQNLGEKPVLLVSHYRDGMKTPSTAQHEHEQIVHTRLKIKADGSAAGSTEVELKGFPAVIVRAVMRALPTGQDELVAKRLLEAQGQHGTATLQKDDPTSLLDTYKLSTSYTLDDFVKVGTPAGIVIKPLSGISIPLDLSAKSAYEPVPRKPQQCSGGRSVEEYVFEFPESLKILAIPKDCQVSNWIVDYKATYRKSGNTLTVRREYIDKTPTDVCSPEYFADFKKIMQSVAKDLSAQVLIGD